MINPLAERQPVSPAWTPFHERLTETLQALTEDQFLIIDRKGTSRYVQFAAQGSFGMRAESVCNAYLEGLEQLTPEDVAMMRALGWSDPTSGPDVTPHDDPDGSPNFFREWTSPVDHAEIAALAIRTFLEVHGAAHPGWLEYGAFDSDDDQILLPGLGLKRAR
jgi:hypothetical protein